MFGEWADGKSTGTSKDDAEILVVDDDESIRLTLDLALQLAQRRVALARDGSEALSWLRNHRAPRLILIDLMMPKMNGWQLLEALRDDAKLSHIPVVIMTAFKHNLGTAAGLPLLTKPIELDALECAVERYCV